MRGWFDLFRENGGPTLYTASNRTPVAGDATTITLCIVFGTLYLAFFVIFPGVRKERFTTFLSVTLSLFVGTAILLGNSGSSWHVGKAEISSAYRAFSTDKIMGRVGVYIGLGHVNVTLDAMQIYYNESMDVHFNERFSWEGPTQLKEEYRNALVKGLPFPILTIAEYMAVDAEGFCWGRTYRMAGYYTAVFLWASFVLWLIMNVLMVVVPRYGAYTMTLTGLTMLFSTGIYYWLLPDRQLRIHIEDVQFSFELGWCFWLIIVAGSLCFMVGLAISVIDLLYPHKWSTMIELDYGTPFDRHTIIDDSHETKKRKKTAAANAAKHPRHLEETMSVGFGGLLRRLSKRDRDVRRGHHMMRHHPMGHDNYAFEMEAPKSPWRYPHLMFRDSLRHGGGKAPNKMSVKFRQPGDNFPSPANGHGHHHLDLMGHLRRADSKDSTCSSLAMPQYPHYPSRFHRTDSNDSLASSLASGFFGSFLSRNNSRAKGMGLMQRGGSGLLPSHLAREAAQAAAMQRTAELRAAEMAMAAAQQRADEAAAAATNASSAAAVRVEQETTAGASATAPPAAPSPSSISEAASAKQDEVTVVVSGGRKNSITKAVRRNSRDNTGLHVEATGW